MLPKIIGDINKRCSLNAWLSLTCNLFPCFYIGWYKSSQWSIYIFKVKIVIKGSKIKHRVDRTNWQYSRPCHRKVNHAASRSTLLILAVDLPLRRLTVAIKTRHVASCDLSHFKNILIRFRCYCRSILWAYAYELTNLVIHP